MSSLSKNPGFGSSANAKLCALRVNGEEQFLRLVTKAIKANHGIIRNAAEALNVHRNTLMKWINHYPSLEQARAEARLEATAAGIK